MQAKTSVSPIRFMPSIFIPFSIPTVWLPWGGQGQGGSRLDTYDRLNAGRGGWRCHDSREPDRSTLFKRITLPQSDKKFMPSEGKPALKPEEIVWIKAWIQQGASPDLQSLAGINVPPPMKRNLSSGGRLQRKNGRVSQAAKAAGVTLVPVSKNLGDGLILNTDDAGQNLAMPNWQAAALCALHRGGGAGTNFGHRRLF